MAHLKYRRSSRALGVDPKYFDLEHFLTLACPSTTGNVTAAANAPDIVTMLPEDQDYYRTKNEEEESSNPANDCA